MSSRTKLPLKTVRVPSKLSRAQDIKAKFDDADDLFDTLNLKTYNAAGAIDPAAGVVFIDSAVALQAMSLADGTLDGQTMSVKFRTKTGAGSVRITPTHLNGGTHWDLTAAGHRGQLIWQTSDNKWHLRAGFDGALA
jgi:hypothetical protein